MSQRVLAIDDETDLLALIRGILGEQGVKVETASSGEEGVTKALESPSPVSSSIIQTTSREIGASVDDHKDTFSIRSAALSVGD